MAVEAVIFDWGGTLTPWLNFDGRGWWRIAAKLVPPDEAERVGALLHAAEEEIWRRSRVEHLSGTLAEVFVAGGLTDHEAAYAAHDAEWEPATFTDPDALGLLEGLRKRSVRVGVLSNTAWTRARHQQIFVRDGIDHLIDGAVYTSEIPWTKPHPEAFRAAMAAVGATDPARCVYVGDRPFEDIHGARNAGMRAVLVPNSEIPAGERVAVEVQPDGIAYRLLDVLDLVDGWSKQA